MNCEINKYVYNLLELLPSYSLKGLLFKYCMAFQIEEIVELLDYFIDYYEIVELRDYFIAT